MKDELVYYIIVREIPHPPVHARTTEEAIELWRKTYDIREDFNIVKTEWVKGGFKVILEHKEMNPIPNPD